MKYHIEFNSSEINGNVFDKAIIGDNNCSISNSKVYTIPKIFPDYLDEVINNSRNKKEYYCATKAKQLYTSKNQEGLRIFIQDNITTFLNGTFATVAGGLLLEIIQRIV